MTRKRREPNWPLFFVVVVAALAAQALCGCGVDAPGRDPACGEIAAPPPEVAPAVDLGAAPDLRPCRDCGYLHGPCCRGDFCPGGGRAPCDPELACVGAGAGYCAPASDGGAP